MELKNWLVISTAVVSLAFIACQKVDDKKSASTREATLGYKEPYTKKRDGKWYDQNNKVVDEATATAGNKKARDEHQAKTGRKGDGSTANAKLATLFKSKMIALRF